MRMEFYIILRSMSEFQIDLLFINKIGSEGFNMSVFGKNKEFDINSENEKLSVLTKKELAEALRLYKSTSDNMTLCASLTKEEIDMYLLSLDRNPVPIDEFVDFYLDNSRQKMEKVTLYLKALMGIDFVVDFFIFDPRINVFNCYGNFSMSDCDILNRYNKMSSFYMDEKEAGRVSFTGNSSNIRVCLHDTDYDEVFPDILADRLFEIWEHRDYRY